MTTANETNSVKGTDANLGEPLVEVNNVKKYFPVKGGVLKRKVGDVKAVDDISFTVYKGETIGIVGESGSGKSTLGRMIIRLLDPTEGEIRFDGEDITNLPQRKMRPHRRNIQMIFQDPYASLNPRMNIGEIIEEPMLIQNMFTKQEREERVVDLLERVGLGAEARKKYPHEFSGGQRQRIGIARALSTRPQMIIGDEPVSALDVSVQSQVLNLMEDLQDEFDLTYMFIAHDLSVVKHISDRVGVMYLGRMAEIAPKDSLYDKPLHPYTQALISAVPSTNVEEKKERQVLEGDLPSPSNPPAGCPFHTRCPEAHERCKEKRPELAHMGEGHYVACHLYTEPGEHET
ncbi:peptide/nickel transport system ATP-binding protein/oligopeptide transport system ATP-binding protein [Salsuginibacillus halophilus]|uniref:Peptide/nickel transport system ATP-binding protein/oligopeptide transport system ATP-binding protein n=1 Tax=Salsuginibacillus halophilus TaxID=517424 RepID=A0A2P8HIB6_9BACI|nr:dipeptide ABC transporter ATP-binding protein [Salsuginibacillus halophilus]PSL45957.1 peptide/nickel transport system ATP-binding protein/oligopeptide transport system ATP-binding protein [Salsuginibacillus halophilus]